MKKRHSAEQIIRILRDVEKGPNVADGVKRNNISEQTYYNWKKKYGSLEVDEAKRLKALEQENLKLKKLVAEQALMIDGLKEISSKNGCKTSFPA